MFIFSLLRYCNHVRPKNTYFHWLFSYIAKLFKYWKINYIIPYSKSVYLTHLIQGAMWGIFITVHLSLSVNFSISIFIFESTRPVGLLLYKVYVFFCIEKNGPKQPNIFFNEFHSKIAFRKFIVYCVLQYLQVVFLGFFLHERGQKRNFKIWLFFIDKLCMNNKLSDTGLCEPLLIILMVKRFLNISFCLLICRMCYTQVFSP